MDKTQKFEFNIPSGNDYYNVEDFNENFRKMDREIMSSADVQEAVGRKADSQQLAAHTTNNTVHITAAERGKWNAKQDAMTVDVQMNATSANPVQNKAVTAAIGAKADQQALNAHTGNGTIHVTAADKSNWNGKQNAMTIDTQMNEASTNPVQNKAVTAAVSAKASQQDLNSHTGNSTVHITAAERASWNGKQNAMTVDAQLNAASANPVQNKAVAAAIGEISSDLGNLRFGVDADGNYGYYKDGADTVTPFSQVYYLGAYTSGTINLTKLNLNFDITKLATDNFIVAPIHGVRLPAAHTVSVHVCPNFIVSKSYSAPNFTFDMTSRLDTWNSDNGGGYTDVLRVESDIYIILNSITA